MPQGIGYSPEVLAALAKIRGLRGVESTPTTSSIEEILKKVSGIRPGMPEPPVSPVLPNGQGGVAELLARLGLNSPPPQTDLFSSLTKATGIGPGTPTLADRFRRAIQMVAGMAPAIGGSGVSPSTPSTGRGDIELPDEVPQPVQETIARRSRMPSSAGQAPVSSPLDMGVGTDPRPPISSPGLYSRLFTELPSGRVDGGMSGGPMLPSSQDVSGQLPSQAPSMLDQFGSNVLSGIAESIVPAIVAWAADRRKSPEIVQAWSQSQARKLQEAELQMRQQISELELYGDFIAAQRANEQLELSRLGVLRGLSADAREMQKEVAPNDPLSYIKGIQGLASIWESAGGDSDMFYETYKIPNAPLLDRLRKDFFDAHAKTALDPSAQGAALVRNPWRPDEPAENFTLEEAAVILGHVSSEGRILQPLGAIRPSDIVEQTVRSRAGVETTKQVPIGQAMREPAVRFPSEGPAMFQFTDPESEEPIIIGFDRRTGRPIFRERVSGARIPQFATEPGMFLRRTLREAFRGTDRELESAKEELRQQGIENPTDEEAREWMESR